MAGHIARPLRLCVGPVLVYATGGLAVTSLKTGTRYTYQTVLGPALTPLIFQGAALALAEFERARRRLKPRILRGDLRRLRVCAMGQLEPRRRISRADFGKKNITLVIAPPAGILPPNGTPVETTVRLLSHQATRG